LNIVQLIKLNINKDTRTYFYDAILHYQIQLKTHCNFIWEEKNKNNHFKQ